VFPCMQQLTEPIVWRSSQQLAMTEAVARGEWRPLFDHTQPLKVQVRDVDDLLSPRKNPTVLPQWGFKFLTVKLALG